MGVMSSTHPLVDLVGKRIRVHRTLHHLLPPGDYHVTETMYRFGPGDEYPGEPLFRVDGCFEPIPAKALERGAILVLHELEEPSPQVMAYRCGVAEGALARIRALVNKQADDDALWCHPVSIGEAYLLQELRRLHDEVEREP